MAFLPADFMFHSHEDHHHHHDHSPSTSLNILPPYHPQDFHGVGPLVLKRSMSFSGVNNNNNNNINEGMQGDDDFSDDGSMAGEKKKIRLNLEQVKALEKSFELGNKLEPDRKMQLARALNLQPRQVAIWFQNRRARWKTKVLERDYDLLKKQFEAVKAHNETLQAQNKKLHAEIVGLRSGEAEGKKESNTTEGYWSSNVSENSPDHHIDISTSTTPLNINTTSSHLSFKQLFPSSFKPTNITQLLQGGTPTSDHLPCPKIMDHQMPHDHHEAYLNMFSSIDDQPGLWPWPEQHHF